LDEPPREGTHPATPLSRVRACLLFGVHLAPGSELQACPLGLRPSSVGHNLVHKKLPQTQSFSSSLSAIFAVPKAPLQHPGAAKLSGQSQGLLFSCWDSSRLHPLRKSSLNTAHLEKAQAGGKGKT